MNNATDHLAAKDILFEQVVDADGGYDKSESSGDEDDHTDDEETVSLSQGLLFRVSHNLEALHTKMETFMSATSEASVGQRRLLKRLADAASSSAVTEPKIVKKSK